VSETQRFKYYFGTELAQNLAERIQAVAHDFPAQAFVEQVAARVDDLELKGRVALIAAALREHLPADYPAALEILCAILGPELPGEEGMFNHGYHLMPVAQFVESYGLEHFELSMGALYEITRRFSSEFAIRPFLVHEQQRTLAVLQQWVSDENAHVRRLVSEGTRTRLPWAARLTAFVADPSPVLALLEHLKHDPSPYVRKSVANNLNDIGKDHADLVLATLTRWSEDASDETRWIIRHALRNRVKQGDPAALRLLDIGSARVTLHDLRVEPDPVCLGDTLHFAFRLHSEADTPQHLVIDYVLHFVRANGSTGPKVFKLMTRTLEGGASLDVRKKHSFKPITTRRYYAGQHRLEIQVNGQVVGTTTFTLEL
jgi:3-methyladenine DNA glycosylase AlkC